MSSALPFVKRGKLQVLSIFICSLKGSIKARFVFSPLSSLCIQQIGAFCTVILLFIIQYCSDDLVMMSFCKTTQKFLAQQVTTTPHFNQDNLHNSARLTSQPASCPVCGSQLATVAIPACYYLCSLLAQRQAFEIIQVKIMFIWKAGGGSCSFPQYVVLLRSWFPQISSTEVASA